MTSRNNILAFIPQRDPFIMVDELIACDETSASTILQVRPDNLFVQNNTLMEVALVENIAQTAAARIGYICSLENKPVPIGYIAAVQNLAISRPASVGDILETEIAIRNQVLNVTIITGNVKVSNSVIASCEMKIFMS